MYLSLSST
jgi:DDE superfamily endonuclease